MKFLSHSVVNVLQEVFGIEVCVETRLYANMVTFTTKKKLNAYLRQLIVDKIQYGME